jgi:hypothetical protein
MLRRVLFALALCSGLPVAASAADPFDEVLRSFTIGGKPIPPEIFADFGDAMIVRQPTDCCDNRRQRGD